MFIINRILFVVNAIVIFALLASYLAPYVSPDLAWPVALLGLTFPAVVLANVLFIIYWLCFLNMKFLFSLAAIVIGWTHVVKFVQLNAKKLPSKQQNSINIVTFNARYFGALDGNPTNDIDVFKEKLELINPDVMCMQEMFLVTDDPNNLLQQHIKTRFANYNKVNIRISKNKWNCENIAMLTKFNVIKSGIVEQDSGTYNYTIFADMIIKQDTIRVINTHLQSIKFQSNEYDAVKNIKLENNPEQINAYKSMVNKMKLAFLMRAKQTDAIEAFITESPYKVIVCGDFNDTPLSYAYKNIKGDMKDAFTEAGSGLGRTYVGAMPSFRIDYIFGHQEFTFYNYYAKAFNFSDHKMVTCSVIIP